MPRARNELGESASVMATELGQSIVWLAKPRINFPVETYWSAGESVVGVHKTQWSAGSLREPWDPGGIQFPQRTADRARDRAVPVGVGPQCWRERHDFLRAVSNTLFAPWRTQKV